MKYTYVLLFLLAGSFLGFGQAPSDEPAELVSARARYTQEADAGIATIKQRYLAGLDLMKRTFGAKGNVNDALAVQKEIDRVAAGKEEPAGTKLPEPKELTAARSAFNQQSASALAPIKSRYAQTLEAAKRTIGARGDVNGALAVQTELEKFGTRAIKPIGFAKEAKLVVWNQHNAGYNDRGTLAVHAALLDKGKEVWRQNGIKIPWEPGKDMSVSVNVPVLTADKLRIELAETYKGHGGLAEIELWKDGRNIAKGRRVTVSGVWESNKKVEGDRLTDGITSSKDEKIGYWLSPDRVEAWAEVAITLQN